MIDLGFLTWAMLQSRSVMSETDWVLYCQSIIRAIRTDYLGFSDDMARGMFAALGIGPGVVLSADQWFAAVQSTLQHKVSEPLNDNSAVSSTG